MSKAKKFVRKVTKKVKTVPVLKNLASTSPLFRVLAGDKFIGSDIDKMMGKGGPGLKGGTTSGLSAEAASEQRAALERSRRLTESIEGSRLQALQQQGLAATGRGPSLAEAQLKSAQDRNLSQMLATAQAGRGVNPALTQRALMQAQSSSGRELAQQAAEQRLAERNQFLGQATGVSQELQTGISGLSGLGAAKDQASLAMAQMRNQAAQASKDRQTQLIGSIISGGSQVGAAKFASDEKLKKDTQSAAKDISKFLETLNAKSYKYKNPEAQGIDDNKHFGVMAQDLEKSKVGKSMVSDTAQGKMVDTNMAVSALLASQSELHKRLQKMEKKNGKS